MNMPGTVMSNIVVVRSAAQRGVHSQGCIACLDDDGWCMCTKLFERWWKVKGVPNGIDRLRVWLRSRSLNPVLSMILMNLPLLGYRRLDFVL
jgi:hypothetical protein